MNNKGADQTAWMRRLVCTSVVRMQQSQVFFCQGTYIAGQALGKVSGEGKVYKFFRIVIQ